MRKKLLLLIFIISLILSGCNHNKNTSINSSTNEEGPYSEENLDNNYVPEVDFTGVKGKNVEIVSENIELNSNDFNTGIAKYFNTKMTDGTIIYFFVVKDRNGIYRAAANACQVCYNARMGFRQEGDYMVCNTCGNKYPLNKIATEKGGCNPGPINPDLAVKNGKLIIKQPELEEVSWFF